MLCKRVKEKDFSVYAQVSNQFLGVPENKPILESDLEKALVAQIEKFLLELGSGWTAQYVSFCLSLCFLYSQ